MRTQTSETPVTAGSPEAGREAQHHVIIVTGPSGAGRSTAIHALEDMDYETIDNMPLSLVERLLDGPAHDRPLVLGIDTRNRDFTAEGLLAQMERLNRDETVSVQVLFLDASDDVLLRRYSETRRRHPLAPSESPQIGIERDRQLLSEVRNRADVLIDTSSLSPHDLRAEVERHFHRGGGALMSISLQSFSYKRGLPRSADMVLDCRFLKNPHWVAELRAQCGLDQDVADYVQRDPKYPPFMDQVMQLCDSLLPSYKDEGKSHFCIAFGCTGGQHRSVAVAEAAAQALAQRGWQVSCRHREMERRQSRQRMKGATSEQLKGV